MGGLNPAVLLFRPIAACQAESESLGTHPFLATISEDLMLPDRQLVLYGFDQVVSRVHGLFPVLRADNDTECDIAYRQAT